MSIAASAENTMKILDFKINDSNNDSNNDNNNSKCKNEDKIFFKSVLNESDDDDMVVIILEEDIQKNNEVEKTESSEPEKEDGNNGNSDDNSDNVSNHGDDADNGIDANVRSNIDTQDQEQQQQEKIITPKQKYIGIEVYTHLQQTLESQKMYPLLPCNMISSFARVMEFVEYFDIPSEERKKLVIDLVKMLAYSNNDYGSRDCFEYFAEHNMIDDIIKTIVDSTKNRYDINRFPHTNRKIVLSCVSLSNKIKIVKPSAKIESIFEEFKLNLCGLKRFFKMKEKDESKQT